MSKKRNYSLSTPRFIKYQKQMPQTASNTIQKSSTICHRESLYSTNNKKYKTITIASDQQLLSIYNKNIGKFRQLVNSNDKSLLPFISSLRDHTLKNENKKLTLTIVKPFEVANKITCNQKIRKDLNDIKGRTKRLTNAFYRWHSKSGSGIKESCYFQSKLRQTKLKFRSDNTFQNLFNPIEKPKILRRLYTESEIICPHQKKVFNFQL